MFIDAPFELLKHRRFLPLFCTQFLGAFNDSVFKNALIILIAFSTQKAWFSADTLVNLCAALFVIPFFLFSSIAGQLADKFEKSRLIRWIKVAELLLVILIALGFYLEHLFLLLSALFLLGSQATFFGPVKYSILPQHLQKSELIAGNGLVEMGTFIAILLGTIVGGILIAIPSTGSLWISLTLCLSALIGFGASCFIPKAIAYDPRLRLNQSPVQQTMEMIVRVYQNPIVFHSIIGISWFWLYGSIFLTHIAYYTRLVLGGTEHVASLLLTIFSIGIGTGSILCRTLSKKFEMGLVLLGALGLTLFALDFSLLRIAFPPYVLGVMEFLGYGQTWRLLIDGFFMGVSGGLFVVPLYVIIQNRTVPEQRSRVIAVNNILNAIFMTGGAICAIVLLNLGMNIPNIFLVTALFNILIAVYLFRAERDFLAGKPLIQ